MAIVYRSGTYRGKSSLDAPTVVFIRTSIFYPYASKSSNVYSHGVCRIIDVRPPFGVYGPVTMWPLHVDYEGPKSMSSTTVFPIYQHATTMALTVGTIGTMYIVTKNEPMYIDAEHSQRYYTHSANGSTENVDAIIEEPTQARSYIMNLIDTSFILPDTGDLKYYAFFAMMYLLSIYKTRARNYIYENNLSDTLLEDYLLEKTLFFNPGPSGMPALNAPIWRLLPEADIAEALLPEYEKIEIADTRDNIIEFLVTNVYSLYADLWSKLSGVARKHVV